VAAWQAEALLSAGASDGADWMTLGLMITEEKLTVFQRYGGDIDGWVRVGTPAEKALMTDADWAAIAELLQRLAVVQSGHAAESYQAETRRLVAAATKDEDVAKRLMECAQLLDVSRLPDRAPPC
jgi:hypothetical protein